MFSLSILCQVIATAAAANLDLVRVEASTVAEVASITPLAKSMALSCGVKIHVGGSSHLQMRILGAHAPASNLCGETDIDKAHVDAWMDFIWASIDLPLAMLLAGHDDDDSSKIFLDNALAKIEAHLAGRAYMVGNDVTIADIALAVALRSADCSTANLARFIDTMTRQAFWTKALTLHASRDIAG